MKIISKKGVRFDVLRDHIWQIFDPIYTVFKKAGYDCVITCGSEGHGDRDPHTNGYAIDLRSWHIKTEEEKIAIRDQMQISLGSDYYVLYEKPDQNGQHFHVQVNKSLWPYLMEHDS